MNAPAQTPASGPVVSLATIGNLFGRSRHTIRRWIEKEGFPAARLPDGTWASSYGLIDKWLLDRAEAQRDR